MELTRSWVAAVTGGDVIGPDAGASVGDGLAFDSRVLAPGEVFVALVDARDGHDFAADAIARGAPFALVERPVPDVPAVRVPDTRRALADLARAGRERLGARVVAITGSVGKTSTKDLTAAALRAGLAAHAAPASFNNEIGVPVTVLGAPDTTEVLVVEMGARFPDNIAELCSLVAPEIGVITNIGMTHAEHLGGPEGVAEVKGELLDALPTHGLAVLWAECDASAAQRARSAAPVITVGSEAGTDVRISGLELDPELHARFHLATPWGSGHVVLGVRGAHMAVNAAQAATVALHLGVSFDAVVGALAGSEVSGWRMRVDDTAQGVRVVNDAYNASPVAVLAALDALAALPASGRRIAVLGEMRELGRFAESEHARMGEAVADRPVDVLVAVGAATDPLVTAAVARRPGLEVHRAADAPAAAELVGGLARPGDVVLVKASRAVGLELVAATLLGEGALA